jgi:CRISPR-associated protein Cmr4
MSDTNDHAEKKTRVRMYWIHALTPIHVGAGRGVGFIDLPIMREAVTNWPLVPGSAVKGVLSDWYGADLERGRNPDSHEGEAQKDAFFRMLAFGRGGEEASNAGSLVFTDALLVCLPVRSLYGTFAWCTCPIALKRLRRDLKAATLDDGLPELAIASPHDDFLPVHVSQAPVSVLKQDTRVFFEDLDFTAVPCPAATTWAEKIATWVFGTDPQWQKLFRERFAVVHDDVFSFLCEHATQVDARVRIDDNSKIVAEGQLWYEESLPTESILAGISWCGPVLGRDKHKKNNSIEQKIGYADKTDSQLRDDLVQQFCQDMDDLQIGGKATVGRGRVRLVFAG